MADKTPLKLVSGEIQQFQSGDTIAFASLNGVAPLGSAITVGAELNSTPVVDTAEGAVGNTTEEYVYFTLPTAAPFYIFTGFEWKNGTSVAGLISGGIREVDANPPVSPTVKSIYTIFPTTQAGTNAVQRVSFNSVPVKGGTVIGLWINCSLGTGKLRYLPNGTASQNTYKVIAYTAVPNAGDAIAWVAGVNPLYIKAYFKPVS